MQLSDRAGSTHTFDKVHAVITQGGQYWDLEQRGSYSYQTWRAVLAHLIRFMQLSDRRGILEPETRFIQLSHRAGSTRTWNNEVHIVIRQGGQYLNLRQGSYSYQKGRTVLGPRTTRII